MNQKARRAVSVEDAADVFIRLERNAVAMSKALGVSIRTLYRIINRDSFRTALDQRGLYRGARFQTPTSPSTDAGCQAPPPPETGPGNPTLPTTHRHTRNGTGRSSSRMNSMNRTIPFGNGLKHTGTASRKSAQIWYNY